MIIILFELFSVISGGHLLEFFRGEKIRALNAPKGRQNNTNFVERKNFVFVALFPFVILSGAKAESKNLFEKSL